MEILLTLALIAIIIHAISSGILLARIAENTAKLVKIAEQQRLAQIISTPGKAATNAPPPMPGLK